MTRFLITLLVCSTFATAVAGKRAPVDARQENKQENRLTKIATYGSASYGNAAVSGDYVFFASGAAGLEIIQFGAGEAVRTASLSLPGIASDVTVQQSRAYVTAGEAGLHVIDIADPANPQLLGSFSGERSYRAVAPGFNFIFALSNDRIDVINTADPNDLNLIDSWSLFSQGRDLVRDGIYLYVADAQQGLMVVNVQNLGAPQITSIGEAQGASRVAVGDHGMVAVVDSEGVNLFEVNGGLAEKQGALNLPNAASAVLDDDLLVVGANGVISMIDISNPQAPVITQNLSGGSVNARPVFSNGQLIAPLHFEVAVLNVKGFNAEEAYRISDVGRADYVEVHDELIYVGGYPGLRVFDLQQGALDLINTAQSEAVSAMTLVDGAVYTAHGPTLNGFQFNAQGQVIAQEVTHTDDIIRDLSFEGSRAWILNHDNQSAFLTRVEDGVVVGGAPQNLLSDGQSLAAGDAFLLVADGEAGLRLLDTQDADNLITMDQVAFDGSAQGVLLNGDIAYVAVDNQLKIFEVTASRRLEPLGALITDGEIQALRQFGNRLYVACGEQGLSIYDLTDAADPTHLLSDDSIGYVADIAVDGDLITTVGGDNGRVTVFHLESAETLFHRTGRVSKVDSRRN